MDRSTLREGLETGSPALFDEPDAGVGVLRLFMRVLFKRAGVLLTIGVFATAEGLIFSSEGRLMWLEVDMTLSLPESDITDGGRERGVANAD